MLGRLPSALVVAALLAGTAGLESARADTVQTTTSLASSGSPAPSGQQVTYTATVSPTDGGGTVSFTDGGAPVAGCTSVALAGSGQATCSQSYAGPGSHSIVAAYSGDSVDAASSSGALDQEVIPVPPASAISIAVSPQTQTIAAGQAAAFAIVVANTGNDTLGSVGVDDPLAPSCDETASTLPALLSLAPGATVTYYCALAGVTAGFTNVATVTGTDPNDQTVNAQASAQVIVAVPIAPPSPVVTAPAISIVNDPKSQTTGSGGTATFKITVTNTGEVALSDVSVTDPLSPRCVRNLGTLSGGQSESYTCSKSNVVVSFRNVATATGSPPTGASVQATDFADVKVKQFVPPERPGIAIVVSPKKQPTVTAVETRVAVDGKPRTTVTYGDAKFTIKITNTGNVVLHGVRVADSHVPGCVRRFRSPLGTGESKTYTCARKSVRGSFTNVATVSGISPKGVKIKAIDHALIEVVEKTTSTSAAGFAETPVDVRGRLLAPFGKSKFQHVKTAAGTTVTFVQQSAMLGVKVTNISGAVLRNVGVTAQNRPCGKPSTLRNGHSVTFGCTVFTLDQKPLFPFSSALKVSYQGGSVPYTFSCATMSKCVVGLPE